MPTDQPKHSVWPTIFAAAVLLAVAYAGAYWWLARSEIAIMVWDWDRSPRAATTEPAYPYDWLTPLFAPAHWIDRHLLRPSYWAPPSQCHLESLHP